MAIFEDFYLVTLFIDDLSVRVVDMNQPTSIERAQVGRLMYFPDLDWSLPMVTVTQLSAAAAAVTQADHERQNSNCKNAVNFDSGLGSRLTIIVPRRRRLNLKFQIFPDQGIL